MLFSQKHIIIKIIAIMVCACFLWQDVVWAAGSDFTVRRSHMRGEQWVEQQGQAAGKPESAANNAGTQEELETEMNHLLDDVHDVLNYFTVIKGWMDTFAEGSFKNNEGLKETYFKFKFLEDERQKWLNKEETGIPFYRLRSEDPANYQGILDAGMDYMRQLRKVFLSVQSSPFMDKETVAGLLKISGLGEVKAEDRVWAFGHLSKKALVMLDNYLKKDAPPEFLNVVSEIEDIVRIYGLINDEEVVRSESQKIHFSVEIEGEESEVRKVRMFMNDSNFQSIIYNLIKNAVYNMPPQQGAFVRIKVGIKDGMMMIRVIDNAGGIPIERDGVEIRNRVFQARVSTKKTKQEAAIKGRGFTITELYAEKAGGNICLEDTITDEELTKLTEDELTGRREAGLVDWPGTVIRVELPVANVLEDLRWVYSRWARGYQANGLKIIREIHRDTKDMPGREKAIAGLKTLWGEERDSLVRWAGSLSVRLGDIYHHLLNFKLRGIWIPGTKELILQDLTDVESALSKKILEGAFSGTGGTAGAAGRRLGSGLAGVVYEVENPDTGEPFVEKYYGDVDEPSLGKRIGRALRNFAFAVFRGTPPPFMVNIYAVLANQYTNLIIGKLLQDRFGYRVTPAILYTRYDEETGGYVQAFEYIRHRPARVTAYTPGEDWRDAFRLGEAGKAIDFGDEVNRFLEEVGLWGPASQVRTKMRNWWTFLSNINLNSPNNIVVEEATGKFIALDFVMGIPRGIVFAGPFEMFEWGYFFKGLVTGNFPVYADAIDFKRLKVFAAQNYKSGELDAWINGLESSVSEWRKSEPRKGYRFKFLKSTLAKVWSGRVFSKLFNKIGAMLGRISNWTRNLKRLLRDSDYRVEIAKEYVEKWLKEDFESGELPPEQRDAILNELEYASSLELLGAFGLHIGLKLMIPGGFSIACLTTAVVTGHWWIGLGILLDGTLRAVATIATTGLRYPAAIFEGLFPVIGNAAIPAEIIRTAPHLGSYIIRKMSTNAISKVPGLGERGTLLYILAGKMGDILALFLFKIRIFLLPTAAYVASESVLSQYKNIHHSKLISISIFFAALAAVFLVNKLRNSHTNTSNGDGDSSASATGTAGDAGVSANSTGNRREFLKTAAKVAVVTIVTPSVLGDMVSAAPAKKPRSVGHGWVDYKGIILGYMTADLPADNTLEVLPCMSYGWPSGFSVESLISMVENYEKHSGRVVEIAVNGGFFDIFRGVIIGCVVRDGEMIVLNMPREITRTMAGFAPSSDTQPGQVFIASPNEMPRYWLNIIGKPGDDYIAHGVNVPLGKDEGFVVYTPRFGITNLEERKGCEDIVLTKTGSAKNQYKVIRVITGHGKTIIPKNGLVVSLKGDVWENLSKNFTVGSIVETHFSMPNEWIEKGVTHAVMAGPRLIMDRKIYITADIEKLSYIQSNERMVLAVTKSGKVRFIKFFHPKHSISYHKMADILYELSDKDGIWASDPIQDAMCLDGGSSCAGICSVSDLEKHRILYEGRLLTSGIVVARRKIESVVRPIVVRPEVQRPSLVKPEILTSREYMRAATEEETGADADLPFKSVTCGTGGVAVGLAGIAALEVIRRRMARRAKDSDAAAAGNKNRSPLAMSPLLMRFEAGIVLTPEQILRFKKYIYILPWLEELLRAGVWWGTFYLSHFRLHQPLSDSIGFSIVASFFVFLLAHLKVYVRSPRVREILEIRWLWDRTYDFRRDVFLLVPGLILSAIGGAWPITAGIHTLYNMDVWNKGGIFATPANPLTVTEAKVIGTDGREKLLKKYGVYTKEELKNLASLYQSYLQPGELSPQQKVLVWTYMILMRLDEGEVFERIDSEIRRLIKENGFYIGYEWGLSHDKLTPAEDDLNYEFFRKQLTIGSQSIKKGNVVVEPGCGDGTVLIELSRKRSNDKYLGLDANPYNIRSAVEKLAGMPNPPQNIRFQVRDCRPVIEGIPNRGIPYGDNEVDVVLVLGGMMDSEGYPDESKQAIWQESLRVIKSGGRIGFLGRDGPGELSSEIKNKGYTGIRIFTRIGWQLISWGRKKPGSEWLGNIDGFVWLVNKPETPERKQEPFNASGNTALATGAFENICKGEHFVRILSQYPQSSSFEKGHAVRVAKVAYLMAQVMVLNEELNEAYVKPLLESCVAHNLPEKTYQPLISPDAISAIKTHINYRPMRVISRAPAKPGGNYDLRSKITEILLVADRIVASQEPLSETNVRSSPENLRAILSEIEVWKSMGTILDSVYSAAKDLIESELESTGGKSNGTAAAAGAVGAEGAIYKDQALVNAALDKNGIGYTNTPGYNQYWLYVYGRSFSYTYFADAIRENPKFLDLPALAALFENILANRLISGPIKKLSPGAQLNLKLRAYYMLSVKKSPAGAVRRYLARAIKECYTREKILHDRKYLKTPSIGCEVEVWECIKNYPKAGAEIMCNFFDIQRGGDGAVEFSLPPTIDYRDTADLIDIMEDLGLIPSQAGEALSLHISVPSISVSSTEANRSDETLFITFLEAFLTSVDARLEQEFNFNIDGTFTPDNHVKAVSVPYQRKDIGSLGNKEVLQFKLGNVVIDRRLEPYKGRALSSHRRALRIIQLLTIALQCYLKDIKINRQESLLAGIYSDLRQEALEFISANGMDGFIGHNSENSIALKAAANSLPYYRNYRKRMALEKILERHLAAIESALTDESLKKEPALPDSEQALEAILYDGRTNIRLGYYLLLLQLKNLGFYNGDVSVEKAVKKSIIKADDLSAILPFPGKPCVGIVIDSLPGMELAGICAGQQERPVNYMYFIPDGNVLKSMDKIYIKYAVLFDRSGKPMIVEFPRFCPLDMVIQGSKDTQSRAYQFLENSPETVSLNNAKTTELCDDKAVLSSVLEKAGMAVPRWNVFKVIPNRQASARQCEAFIKRFIRAGNTRAFVLKPRRGSCGDMVKMFTARGVKSAAEYMKTILGSGEDVIIQERIKSAAWHDPQGKRLDWNVRVLATWDAGNVATSIDMMEVRYKSMDGYPVNVARGASVMSMREFTGKMKPQERDDFIKGMEGIVAKAQAEVYRQLIPGQRPGLIGWDLIQSGTGEWFIIEANTGAVGGIQTLEGIYRKRDPERRFSAILPVLEFIAGQAYSKRDDGSEGWNIPTLTRSNMDIRSSGDFLFLLSYAYFDYDSDKSIVILNKITSTDNSDPEVFLNLGLAYYEVGDYFKCEQALKKAVYLGPDDKDNCFHYADILYINGNAARAGIFARRALRLDPNSRHAKRLLSKINRSARDEAIARAVGFAERKEAAILFAVADAFLTSVSPAAVEIEKNPNESFAEQSV